MNQNEVKSITQLLSTFEDSAPNAIFQRQGSLQKEFSPFVRGTDICIS